MRVVVVILKPRAMPIYGHRFSIYAYISTL